MWFSRSCASGFYPMWWHLFTHGNAVRLMTIERPLNKALRSGYSLPVRKWRTYTFLCVPMNLTFDLLQFWSTPAWQIARKSHFYAAFFPLSWVSGLTFAWICMNLLLWMRELGGAGMFFLGWNRMSGGQLFFTVEASSELRNHWGGFVIGSVRKIYPYTLQFCTGFTFLISRHMLADTPKDYSIIWSCQIVRGTLLKG